MRAFIAILIPDEIRKKLAQPRDEKLVLGEVRWVAEENLHLTLKFLGEVEEKKVADVIAALERAASRHPPMTLVAHGLGFFPNLRSPRVFWAGLEPNPTLSALSADVERECAALGFEKEDRPFSGHITLARIRGRVKVARESISSETPHFGDWPVREIVLVESKLSPKGAQYFPVAKAPMREALS
jgi:2'-5' RNA ligase